MAFVVGAAGSFCAAAMAICFGLGSLLVFFSTQVGLVGVFAATIGLVLGVALSVAMLLHLVGFYGMWRDYGSPIGAATFGFGVAAIGVLLLTSVATPFSVTMSCHWGYCYTQVPLWAQILSILALVLLGVLLMLEGVAMIAVRRFTGSPGLAIAGGVVSIIGGSLVVSILLALLGGFFVVTVGLLLDGMVLVQARLPLARPAARRVSPPAPTALPWLVRPP